MLLQRGIPASRRKAWLLYANAMRGALVLGLLRGLSIAFVAAHNLLDRQRRQILIAKTLDRFKRTLSGYGSRVYAGSDDMTIALEAIENPLSCYQVLASPLYGPPRCVKNSDG